MNSKTFSFQGTKMNITRCGYTGEDGFEIQISDQIVVEFVKKLLSYEITLSGLGARDTLRLEAVLCLMTHDIAGSKLKSKLIPLIIRRTTRTLSKILKSVLKSK